MAQELDGFMNKTVSVIAGDGRNFVGMMKGFDQTINIILEGCHERVYSEVNGITQIPLGLYVVRGDNVAVIGELDDELDRRLDLAQLKAAPLEPFWIPS